MGRPSTIKAVTAVQAIAPVAIPAVSASAKPRMSGVAVAPGAKLAISFTASQPVGELRISLSSVADVSVRTADPAATFTSSDGQLRVSNAGSQASFDLEVPVSAVRVEIFVDGHLRYVKDHRRITSASASRRGALYVIPLQPLSWINP